MAEPVLSLQSVNKRFGNVKAVDQVAFDVAEGEFFSLLGPSGSGKTTLLRIIAGLEIPNAGRVVVNGRDATELPPYRRDIGMVFQDFLLFPHKNVRENVVFPLRMQGASQDVQKEQLAWVLNLVRLEGLEDRYPHQLSGGQKQRVALGRGLVSRPSLLLLDEPLANLDRELRKEMEVEVRRFQNEIGIPFVYVTHNQEEALTLSDRMAVMHLGRIEQLGPKLDLYNRPATRFVASFVGSPNRIEARVVEADGEVARLEWAGRDVHARGHDGLKPGMPAVCYVKSERISIAAATSAATTADTKLDGKLRDIIFKGLYSDYIVTLPGGQELIVSGPPAIDGLSGGEDVAIAWQGSEADAFPSEESAR